MDRAQKKALIETMNAEFKDSAVTVVVHYQGLTVAEITKLRRSANENGVKFRVTKNTLTKLALKGTELESISSLLKGPTAVAYGVDPVAAAKVMAQFAKENDKLVLVGGAMGTTALDASGVKQLATLPSLDELRGKLVGLLLAPATKVAGVIQAAPGQLARVVNAYATK